MLKKFSRFYLFFNLVVVLGLVSCTNDPKSIEDGDLKYELGRKLHARGQTIEAIQSLQESVKVNPKNFEAYNFLGLLYFERNMYPEAKKSFLKAVSINNKFSDGYNHLCVLHGETGEYTQAISYCYKALGNVLYITPERAYYNLAKVYEKMGDRVKVKEMHQKALGFNHRFVLSLKDLGQIQYQEKDYVSATKNLSLAIEACKASPKGTWQDVCSESNYDLALTFLQTKEPDRAKEAFQSCVLEAKEESDIFKKCQKRLSLIH